MAQKWRYVLSRGYDVPGGRLDWGVMVTQRTSGGMKRRKRKLSEKQRRIYRRRRVVVGVAALLVLALVVFCVYSLGRGIWSVGAMVTDDRPSISRSAIPDPISGTGVRDCSGEDLALELSVSSGTVEVGGSITFSAGIVYTGEKSCLVDGSASSRVLTITSGSDQIWRSDACPADARMLLMASGDKDVQGMKWNTNRSGGECVKDSELPKVAAGTYVAQLSLRDHPEVVSQQVPFIVQ